MARQTNYAEKISAIEAKIAKKQSEIKTLKVQLSSLKNKKSADDYKALTEYMTANDLSASDVWEFIKA